MPRFLVACDKFKGSLSAPAACAAVAAGIHRTVPTAEIDLCPIADGGEGFVDAILSAHEGSLVRCGTVDALGRPIQAKYGLIDGERGITAVLEMAEAAGLWRIAEGERDILHANTRGVGMLLRHATVENRVEHIVLGIGGSATNDGGVGMLHELGVRFLDALGRPLPPYPARMVELASVDRRGLARLPPLTVACDVTNPLLGPRGAVRVFAPQKGAGEAQLALLEAGLQALKVACGAANDAEIPGAGAAGGTGFGLHHFYHAELCPGFDIVSRTVNLPARVAAADVVVTGEGSLDSQSLAGKGPAGVALQALLAAKPVIALVGVADHTVKTCGLFHHIAEVLARGHSVAHCIAHGAEVLEDEAAAVPWEDFLAKCGA